MNVRLLRKVANHIAAEPQRLIMGRACRTGREIFDEDHSRPGLATHDVSFSVKPPCNTAACYAGWSLILGANANPEDISDDFWVDVKNRAMALLQLEPIQAINLFQLKNWPHQFRCRYVKAKSAKGRASAAVGRIEHFIATKGKE